ncbi:MAG: hypothetical protein HYV04_10930 [Deltaproteobacteria bacterium]|nr:hypothetical protein [Deltaproteobacteria bacterium]
MELQKINVKVFVAEPDQVPLTAFIDIFHSWIQATDGVYYDVADYSHMRAGPGILLIAHEANVSIDETGGRRGLLYNRKQTLQGSNAEKLRSVFRSALEYCRRIEAEPTLRGKIKFLGNEALFVINDRLLAPNGDETFYAVRADLEDLARSLYGGAAFTLDYEIDPGKRFSVTIRAPVAFDIGTLLKNLEEQSKEAGRRLVS